MTVSRVLQSVRNVRNVRFVRMYSSENKIVSVEDKRKTAAELAGVKPENISAIEISSITGLPEEHRQRTANIYQPARNPMQQGTNGIKNWRVDFDMRERWENPMMGWTSSADPLSNIAMEFATKEEAVEFCTRQGWGVFVRDLPRKKVFTKNYGDNFSWDTKKRVSTK